MKILKTLLVGILAVNLTTLPVYGASNGKGKGADNGQGKGREEGTQGNQGQGNQGNNGQNQENKGQGNNQGNNGQENRNQGNQGRGNSSQANNSRGNSSQSQGNRGQGSQGQGNNAQANNAHGNSGQGRGRAENANVQARDNQASNAQPARADRGRSADRFAGGSKDARAQLDNLANALNRLSRARWSHNPNDERGQGNMGKPDMKDPYGFDKDSDREKSERGRPIKAVDTDGDGVVDSRDTDDDNDGVLDTEDIFPLDSAESRDADQDGVGDNADTDDDNDGVADTEDAFPFDATETSDADADGVGDNADTDDDNDGVADTEDVFPFDATESRDTDGDGVGDNADTDDDNDGVVDTEDVFPFDVAIDFSSIDSMQWLVNWYESAVASYYKQDYPQERYTYEQWESMWYNHFFPGGDLNTATGIRLNNGGDTSERYHYDIALNGFEGDSVTVTTKMTLSEGYLGRNWYIDENGYYRTETTEHQAGEVVYEQTKEIGVDPTADALTVGIAATDDLIEYASSEVYVDMEVTVTDPSTGATYTQTYDKQLYLYRCPYGKVYNAKTGKPVEGARVTVHYEDGSLVALDKASNPTASNPQITDATGRYGFKLATNRRYYLTASAPGYKKYKSRIFTERWHVLREDIALTPVEELALNLE